MSASSASLLIFSFQFSLLFFLIGRQTLAALLHISCNTYYRTLDVAENLGRYLSCTERTSQGKYFELILTVKVETRHPVEVVNFRQSVIVAELWRPEVARPYNVVSTFCVFGKW